MSWAYYRSGRASALRFVAAKELEKTASQQHIESEAASVRAVAALIDIELAASGDKAVQVSAGGSVTEYPDSPETQARWGNRNVTVEVKTLGDFVHEAPADDAG